MKDKITLYLSGFIQVFMVVINTYFISKGFLTGIAMCSFIISLVWSFNVKKIAFGTNIDRIIYATGAMYGSIAAFFIGKLII